MYLDDILVFTDTREERRKLVRRVLEALRKCYDKALWAAVSLALRSLSSASVSLAPKTSCDGLLFYCFVMLFVLISVGDGSGMFCLLSRFVVLTHRPLYFSIYSR